MSLLKKIKKKMNHIFSMKYMTIMGIAAFCCILLPIFMCSFVNRASGDDFGYSALTRNAWLSSHSLIEVLKAAKQTVINYYWGWQGTWFSIFLFALQPEVFHEKLYSTVAFFMLFIWIISTVLLIREIITKKLNLDKWYSSMIIVLFLILNISFIPSTKSAIFWYNGCAHYMIPFSMCQMTAYWLLKWTNNYDIKDLIKITIFTALLGGANYQASLLVFILCIYCMFFDYLHKKNKKVFFLILPVFLELIGLYISIKSPGNKIRGGEEFGFSMNKIMETIGLSFVEMGKDSLNHIKDHPIILGAVIIIFVLMLVACLKRENKIEIAYSLLFIIALICLQAALQAPEIYAGVDVSRGVENTNFQIFLWVLLGVLLIIANCIALWMDKRELCFTKESHVLKLVLVSCCFLAVIFRSDIKETTSWICLEYLVSGQARDYKFQMDEQTEIMMNEEIRDVVVPFINDVQGPLMHMPITENPEAWTSIIAMEYYNKDSVVAMDRVEWYEKYAK